MNNEETGARVNHHEAGHALGCIVHKLEFTNVEAYRGFFGGYTGGGVTRLDTGGRGEDWKRHEIKGVLVMGAMGAAAERHLNVLTYGVDDYLHDGSASDRAITEELIVQYRQPTSWDKLLDQAYLVVVANWPRLAGIAAALEAKKKLSAAQAERAKELRETAA